MQADGLCRRDGHVALFVRLERNGNGKRTCLAAAAEHTRDRAGGAVGKKGVDGEVGRSQRCRVNDRGDGRMRQLYAIHNMKFDRPQQTHVLVGRPHIPIDIAVVGLSLLGAGDGNRQRVVRLHVSRDIDVEQPQRPVNAVGRGNEMPVPPYIGSIADTMKMEQHPLAGMQLAERHPAREGKRVIKARAVYRLVTRPFHDTGIFAVGSQHAHDSGRQGAGVAACSVSHSPSVAKIKGAAGCKGCQRQK